jgi:long-chain acyl-CoA synthetase
MGTVFDVGKPPASITKNRCTGIYGITTMFVSYPRSQTYDMSSLRFAIFAGSAVPKTLVRKIRKAFGIALTHTNWGLTESASICTMMRDTDTIEKRCLTSGRLFLGIPAKIVDPATNLRMRRGQKGEIE